MKGYNLVEKLDLIPLDELEQWMNENARQGQCERIDPEDVLTGDPSEDASPHVAHLRLMVAERFAADRESDDADDNTNEAPVPRPANRGGASSGFVHWMVWILGGHGR